MPAKLDRCVADVKAEGGVDNPWAVCNASIKESEDDICLECGEARSQHGLFTNHKFEEDVEEFEDDDDDIVITISRETTDKGPKPMPPVNTVEQSPLYDKGIYNETHNPLDIPFGREVPGDDSISDGLDEAVAIGGGLSAVSIGGKKKLEECLPCQNFDAVHKALTKKASHVSS